MKENLFIGSLGNGWTVADMNITKNGDFKRLAHVNNQGIITWYAKKISPEARAAIQEVADRERKYHEDRENMLSEEQKKRRFDGKVYKFMLPTFKTYKSRTGRTVHEYHAFPDIFHFEHNIIELFGRETRLKTPNDGYLAEFFIADYFCNVSYCEGDVRVVFFKDEKDMIAGLNDAMKFYEEDGIKYNMSAELFLIAQHELIKETV